MPDPLHSALGEALAKLVAEVVTGVVRDEIRAAIRDSMPAPRPLPPTEAPELLRVEQVAELLQVTPATVRQWIREGHLQATQLGPAGARRGYRVRRRSIEEFVSSVPQADDVSTRAAKIVHLHHKR